MYARQATNAVVDHLRAKGIKRPHVISNRCAGRMITLVDTRDTDDPAVILELLSDFDAEEITARSAFVSIIHN